MISGARPAPRFEFSIGNGGLCRACESADGVQTPHSSTRILFGVEKMRPRGGPGSVSSSRHIPIEEPFKPNATDAQKRIAAPRQHHWSKLALSRAPNRDKNPASRFLKRRIRRL